MKKIGLVLAGGGGKGAYQVGVMKALHELQLTSYIHAISGTSVGALNGALLLSGNIERAIHAWETIAPSKILSIQGAPLISKLTANMKPLEATLLRYSNKLENYGVFSRQGMEQLIDTYVHMPTIATHRTALYATCFNVSTFQKERFLINHLQPQVIKSVLLATSAIPVVFPPEIINGHIYLDGGLTDNIPIEPLYEAGCDIIIVVPLNRTTLIQTTNYPNARIYEIIPQHHLGNVVSGTMKFDAATAKERIQQGYEDAMRILNPVISINRYAATIHDAATIIVQRDRQFQAAHTQNHTQFQQQLQSLQQKITKGRLQ